MFPICCLRWLACLGIVYAVGTSTVEAQALPNLAVARVRYATLKRTATLPPPAQAELDTIDRDLAEATRLGRTGEVRRLLGKGTALLNGRPWTDLDEYDASLVLRTDELFVDTDRAWKVRLEQIFLPSLELTAPVSVRAAVRPLLSQPSGTPEVRELTRVSDVARDLRESPFGLELKLAGVSDGPYVLDVEVLQDERSLGTVNLRVWLLAKLDERLDGLEAAARNATEAVQPDLRYPASYMAAANRGAIEVGNFDLPKELDAAEGVAAQLASGRDPFASRTGDFERHYELGATREIMPYRVFVPSGYSAKQPAPLVVALHGLGATEDSFFDAYGQHVPRLAEAGGYLVAAPLGFRVDGFYGSGVGADMDPGIRRTRELSEQDVMEVLRRMRRDYNVDASRIYLLGHSMGAIGTWHLAAKYNEVWAAAAPFAGLGDPKSVVRMKHIPQFVVHGDKDVTVPVTGSRAMVAAMKEQGVDVTYLEIAGGGHNDVVAPNLEKAFEFFGRKRRVER